MSLTLCAEVTIVYTWQYLYVDEKAKLFYIEKKRNNIEEIKSMTNE